MTGWEIPIAVTLIGVSGVFAYLSCNIGRSNGSDDDEDNTNMSMMILRILFLALSLGTLITAMGAANDILDTVSGIDISSVRNTITTTASVLIWTFRLTLAYIFIVFFIQVGQYLFSLREGNG